MHVWILLIVVFIAGFVGGVINAIMSDNGFILPKRTGGILRPGYLGNTLIGGVAAIVSWSLYGPLAATSIFEIVEYKNSLTLSSIGGSILVGIAGARWLSNEVDKSLLRAAGLEAAQKSQSSKNVIDALGTRSPAQALQAVQSANRLGEEEGPPLKRQ